MSLEQDKLDREAGKQVFPTLPATVKSSALHPDRRDPCLVCENISQARNTVTTLASLTSARRIRANGAETG
jgi:hypothetical protein